jgi:hypothetical protein
VSEDDRVKQEIDTGERGDVSSGGAGRFEAVTAGGAANATVHAGGGAAERAGDKEGGERPFLLGNGVEVRRWVRRRRNGRDRGCEWLRPASPIRCRWREATAGGGDQHARAERKVRGEPRAGSVEVKGGGAGGGDGGK